MHRIVRITATRKLPLHPGHELCPFALRERAERARQQPAGLSLRREDPRGPIPYRGRKRRHGAPQARCHPRRNATPPAATAFEEQLFEVQPRILSLCRRALSISSLRRGRG